MTGPAGVIQLVDEDLTTVRFDLNDETGATNPGGLKTLAREFRPRLPELEVERFSPTSFPGGHTLHVRDPLTVMAWNQVILGSAANTFEELTLGAQELTRLLRSDSRVLKWIPPGSAEARYYDLEPSDGMPLLGDEPEDLFRALTSRQYPAGIPIAVVRQPYRRIAELDPAAVYALTNPMLLIDRGADGRPDLWTWDNTANISAEAISAALEGYQFTVAIGAARNLQQVTGAASAAPGDVWTFSFYARVLAVAGTPRAQAVIEYLDSGSIVLATHTGTLTTLTTSLQRLSVTTTAAPASTDRIRVSLRESNTDATSVTVIWARAQLEKASATSRYRCPAHTFSNDPTVSGQGRILPVWIEGSAPCPLRLKVSMGSGSNTVRELHASRQSKGLQGNRRLSDLLNRHHFRIQDATSLSAFLAAISDATAIGGNAMLFQSPRRQFVRANGNSAAPAATWPATTLAGSTLLMFLVIDFAGTNTTITPPGTWVQVNITAGTTQMRVVGYKIENAGARSGTETFALGVAKAWGVILVELIGSGVVDISGIANDDTANLAFSRLSGASATQPDAYSIAVVGNQGTAAAQSIDASYVYWTQLFNDTTPNLGVGVYEYVATSILAGAADIIGALSASARDAVMTVVVKITSPTPALQRLFRQEISTKLDSLRGSLGIYLRIKPNAQDEWRFTVKWTPSLGVANLALPAIIRSWRTAPTFSAWVEIKIGSIRVPEQGGLAGVALELWTERVSTSIKGADLNPGGAAINPFRLDSLILVPEDDTASLINTKGETQKWLGSELVTPVVSPGSGTAGVIVGSEMQLNTPTTDNAGTRPNSGVAFPAGVHRFIFKLRHDTTNPTITLAIRNITDGNDTAVQTLILSSTFMTISMLVTLVTGKSYQAQVRAPSMVATASIFVQSIERTFVPTLVSGQAAMTDAGSDPPFAHVVDASDNILASLALDGPLPDMLEPGLNLINVAVFDPAALGFDEPESVLSRTGTLAVAHAPRFFE